MEKKKTFKELFAGTGIEPTTDENGGIHYNFNATLKKEPMKEIESNCLYCDINFIAIEHKSGECPNCKEKYEWDYDGDYGVDSVYGIQWLSTYPINKNKKTMKLTSTETTNTSFLVSTLERPCGTVYINPYKLCEKCGKQEKNANSLFALPNECHCPSPKTDLELLQDEVKSLTKKVNKLIKQQQINK